MRNDMPKAVVFARKPTSRESIPSLRLQCNLLDRWAETKGMRTVRTYESTDSHYLVARDIIDAMVGYSIREGVDAMLFWEKEMLDDDSLELIAEVSHTYGIDVWFVSDDDERPWNEDDDDTGFLDEDTVRVSDPHARIEVFVLAHRGDEP